MDVGVNPDLLYLPPPVLLNGLYHLARSGALMERSLVFGTLLSMCLAVGM
jgi:hypothetical protein